MLSVVIYQFIKNIRFLWQNWLTFFFLFIFYPLIRSTNNGIMAAFSETKNVFISFLNSENAENS